MSLEPIRPEVFEKVRACVAESLAIEESEVKLESRLVDDLGASSLDFIDIVFMLEKELGIRVRDSEFSFLTRLDFSSPEVMKAGFLTRTITDQLAEWLPALAALEDRDRVTPRQLFSFITVEAICLVSQRRAASALAPSARHRGHRCSPTACCSSQIWPSRPRLLRPPRGSARR
jgi:acyl carrier protein